LNSLPLIQEGPSFCCSCSNPSRYRKRTQFWRRSNNTRGASGTLPWPGEAFARGRQRLHGLDINELWKLYTMLQVNYMLPWQGIWFLSFFFLNELEGPRPLQDFITKMKVEARYKTAESTKEFGSSISNRHGSHTTKQGDLQQARLTTWPTRLHNQRY